MPQRKVRTTSSLLPQGRTKTLTVFFLLAFIIVAVRLIVLQLLSSGYYKSLAEDQYNFFRKLIPVRGEIKVIDAVSPQGFTVATNINKNLAYAVPKAIKDSHAVAVQLAPVLGIEVADIEPKLQDKTRGYVVLKRQLSDDQSTQIENAKIVGVVLEPETIRFYPEKTLLSHVVGFVGYKNDSTEKEGLYGLEKYFQKDLAGTPGSLSQEKDATGAWIFGGKRELKPAQDGINLVLTVDRSIQAKAESLLEAAVTKNVADSGCITVMNPKTGAILAMASFPNFDPNEYNKASDPAVFNNICTIGNYEPGSVFKAFTMASAIDAGKITPDTTYTDTGKVEIDGYTIKNSDNKAHGVQNMTQVLDESLNTGVIFAKNQIGDSLFLNYITKFGFGKKTGVELPESSGDLSNLKGAVAVNYATASFGQGISVTPIQLVQAYSAFANNGRMVKPYIVQAKIDSNGKTITTQSQQSDQIISPQTATTVSVMLRDVVVNGHGKHADVPGYTIVGKTGTAQVAKKDGKGYEQNNNIGSFVGFGPAEDPKFVAIVRINHPRTVQFAETTAAPAFGELAQFILNYYNVPPTRSVGTKK